jgi:hypothetical protein
MFGVAKFIDEGGVIDAAGIESGSIAFTGEVGFPVHFGRHGRADVLPIEHD